MTDLFILATARDQIADFLNALLLVYVLIIFAYILSQLIFSFGGRVPYSRASSAILGFLRDVCEPYLSIFRRFIPPIGPVDISPIVARPRAADRRPAASSPSSAGEPYRAPRRPAPASCRRRSSSPTRPSRRS